MKRVLFWSYDRGTWQYEILCGLILAFIFLTPQSLFRDPWKPVARNVRDAPTWAETGDGEQEKSKFQQGKTN
ncbi:MAG: hypothetical protein HY652_06920 [Acidobacteria bacterium]|nr:hypothetical protein [Acidobacteriota bacterium]